MVAWLPAFKTILPYVSQIVSLAVPAFTKRSDASASQEVVNQQILELQEAVTRDTEAIRVLAAQLQKTIADIDKGAARLEKELQNTRQLCVVAITMSGVAILLGLVSLLAGR